MNFKKLSISIALVATMGCSAAHAVVVDTSLWTAERDPSFSNGPTTLTSSGGNSAEQSTNSYGAIISDFTFTGDFSFTGFMTATTVAFNDDDLMGLVFGYQDKDNHYRIGWEQGGYNDTSGASGLYLVREVAGVSSILFQTENFWTDNFAHAFSAGRTGNDISFLINGVSFSITDTTYMSGRVGFWTASQTARFSGLTSQPQAPGTTVAEPATLGMMGFALFGLGFMRRRKA